MRRQLEFASRLFQNIDYLDHSEDYLDESILWPYEQYEWLFVLQGSTFQWSLVLPRPSRIIYPHEWQKVLSGYDSIFPASRRIVRNVPSCLMFVQPWLYASSFAYVLAFVQRCRLLCVLFFTELDRDHLQSGSSMEF